MHPDTPLPKRRHPRHRPALVLLCAVALAFCGACDSGGPPEPELGALARAFREANQAETIEPMLDLYHLEGTDARTVRLLKGALRYELGLPIESIRFEPLTGAPEEAIGFVHDGVAYGPSLEPGYRMVVRYDVEDGFTSRFTIGKTASGEWHIVCARPQPELKL